MKNKFNILLVWLFCSPLILAGCDTNSSNSVPVYRGMTVSKTSNPNELKLNSDDSTEQDGHTGHDDNLEQSVQDLVTLDIKDDGDVKYYVNPLEVFTIEIHLSNPMDYEIQSFTLNGKKYANYMFKEGSTMEKLLLETTAPSTPGYFDYTIDAIKYIDGTEIKDVDMRSGNKSITTGIAYEAAPVAQITSQEVSISEIKLGVNVSDQNHLIGSNELAIYLTDGKEMVDSKKLAIGDNEIVFDDLLMSTSYQYGVLTAYDFVDGRGLHEEWLLTNTFKTSTAFAINNVKSGKESIYFDVERNGSLGRIESVSLYDAKTNELVEKKESDSREFTGLLSDHEYNLYVDFSYEVGGTKIDDWVASKGIATIAKVRPTLSLSGSSDKTSVSYEVSSEDADGILSVTKAELLLDGAPVQENGSSLSGTFSGLLSGRAYSVRVSYEYDLNDGNGPVADFVSEDVSTVAKIKPTLSLSGSSDKTSVSYEVSSEDADGILSVTKAELLLDGAPVQENGSSLSGTFSGLLSGRAYSVRVSYEYDLNDGNGPVADFVSEDVSTVAKVKPALCITDEKVTGNSIIGKLTLEDIDSVDAIISSVDLYKDNEKVASNGANEISFADLEYYTDYDLVVSYSYDLNDGNGVQTDSLSKKYKTSPYFILTSCEVINTSIVQFGQTIYMQASLENPRGAIPISAIVNGKEYMCSGSSNKYKIYIEIINGDFEDENVTLTIEGVNVSLGGKNYFVSINKNNTDNVNIQANPKLLSVSLVNSQGKEVSDYSFKSEELYLRLDIKNTSNLSSWGIIVNDKLWGTSYIANPSSSPTGIDDNYTYLKISDFDSSHGWSEYEIGDCWISDLSGDEPYEGEIAINVDENCNRSVGRIYKLSTDTITEISSASEFLSTSYEDDGGSYYKLTNDIDLSGIEWTNAGRFYGVLDGNGYSIKNMTNVSTVNNKFSLIGLFEAAEGVFKNVNLENVTIMMNITNSTVVFGGFIAGEPGGYTCRAIFKNCSISGDVNIKNLTGNDIYIGGFVGFNPSGDFFSWVSCEMNMNIVAEIQGTSGCLQVGGLIGYDSYGPLSVCNSKLQGSIDATAPGSDYFNSIGVIYGYADKKASIESKNNTCDFYINKEHIIEI